MPYNPLAIANYFLDLARSHGEALTPMKVQKLVYFAHGWFLGLNDAPLVDEQVEAWPFGPVIPSLYFAFREYGDRQVEAPAMGWDFRLDPITGEESDCWVEPRIEDAPDDLQYTSAFLNRVWELYGGYSAIQLSNLTHVPGSPWHQVYTEYNGKPPKGTDIPRDVIRDYFARQARERAAR